MGVCHLPSIYKKPPAGNKWLGIQMHSGFWDGYTGDPVSKQYQVDTGHGLGWVRMQDKVLLEPHKRYVCFVIASTNDISNSWVYRIAHTILFWNVDGTFRPTDTVWNTYGITIFDTGDTPKLIAACMGTNQQHTYVYLGQLADGDVAPVHGIELAHVDGSKIFNTDEGYTD